MSKPAAAFSVVDANPDHRDIIVRFNAALASETEGKSLDVPTLRSGVDAILADPSRGFYLVAENPDVEAAGSLLVTFEWSDWRNGWFWWIQSVYVHRRYRRQGVYALLYETVRERAHRRDDVYGFRLYVEVENVAAQRTYRRLGMSECDYRMYEAPLTLGAP